MKQLKMIRYRAPICKRALPEGWRYELYHGTREEIADWIEICKNGLFGPNLNEEAFGKYILRWRDLVPEKDLFFVVNAEGMRVATIAYVRYADGTGYVHCVGSLPETRGKGVGHAMISHALEMGEEREVSHTVLTTDDFRLAAIKTYLDAGFLPVLYHDPDSDMGARWDKVLAELHYRQVEYIVEE
ncbi:MAG: GNAT family N-acetyltransferase [Clostridia bacterium]|nr:GNAT family N-acetyltransferase [Clostridia bacterium]